MSDDPVEEIKRRKLEELQSEQEGSAPDEPIPLDGSAELQSLVDDYQVVVVDFYADWCGPCKQLAPALEQLAAETPATVVKVDTEEYPDVAGEWNVRALPTLLLFAEGEQVERLSGLQPYDRLQSLVERHAPA